MVDEAEQSESEESSEYEEYSDSEDETGPRLKPVFVRKYIVYKMLYSCVWQRMTMCNARHVIQDGSSDNPRERRDGK